MPSMRRKAIAGTMIRAPIIPKRHIALPPLESRMEFLRRRHNFIQIRYYRIALHFRDPDDGNHKARVEEQRFPARDGVRAD